jgi:hypothetical protein
MYKSMVDYEPGAFRDAKGVVMASPEQLLELIKAYRVHGEVPEKGESEGQTTVYLGLYLAEVGPYLLAGQNGSITIAVTASLEEDLDKRIDRFEAFAVQYFGGELDETKCTLQDSCAKTVREVLAQQEPSSRRYGGGPDETPLPAA